MQSPSFILFGLTFHWYGILVGLAVAVAFSLAEKRAIKSGVSANEFSRTAFLALVMGFVGARLWHVATDWFVYAENPWAILYLWQGGMSIFGGILGGFVGLWWAVRKNIARTQVFTKLSDSIALALPIGQAIGRLGNWANQELYGFPTNLPWGIFIAPDHRLPGLAQIAYYHPLFAYEAVALLAFAVVTWRLEKSRPQTWKIGRGKVTICYILFYCVLRFLLDFLRPDKVTLFGSFGVNQGIVAVIAIGLVTAKFLKKVKT